MNKPLTIGAVCHFHSERHALPGFIEAAKAMFDEVVLVSSPMDGTPHCEESLAIARASGCKVILDTLSQGFGVLRTRCISYSSCDWVFVLDADERLPVALPQMTCHGTEKFPDTPTPRLTVDLGETIDQWKLLREVVTQAEAEGALAICLSRRHWFDPPNVFSAPCQNWLAEPDFQLRLVRNSQWLFYDLPMHEVLKDTRTGSEPKFLRVTDPRGPFVEHHSHFFRKQEPEQNTEDIATYEALSPGCTKTMWISHQPQA